jgi:hypothetical protein
MGRIEWFRHWRYDESTRFAEDQELLQRSYRMSRFANLAQIVLGYREERITLGGLLVMYAPVCPGGSVAFASPMAPGTT